jgi:hypothetical protein
MSETHNATGGRSAQFVRLLAIIGGGLEILTAL